MPVANTIREAFQYAQPEHDPNEAAILGDITRASQQVASYLQYQSERFSSGQFVRQQTQLFSTDCQTDTPNIQDSPTQTEQVDDVRERILWLEEVVGQKDIAINALTEERDHLNRLYSDLHNVYSELQRNATENTQSETFRASINELQHNIDILTNERNSLQVELDSQKSQLQEEISNLRHQVIQLSAESSYNAQIANERNSLQVELDSQRSQLQEEISNLRHQVVQLSAESSYNAQIANERDYFRQQLVELQTHLGSQPVLINADFSQQFEVALSTIEQSTQTTSQSEETKKAILSENSEVLPQFSANAMTRVVQEQREILQACIEESVQMESYMSTGVEHLMALNSELEQCAESIKAQVYALNQQIARELTEQISENLESGRLVSNEQMEQLRSELAATRAENELNLQRIEQFENSHRMLQKTYEDLIERYTILQEVLFNSHLK
jgi:BMFP domain-containing protein YqiC